MGTVAEQSNFDPSVYLIEVSDPVQGGEEGISNIQAKQLANRTLYLKDLLTQAEANITALQSAVEALQTGSGMSAQEILDAVKSLDGAGSGLDADTLQGQLPAAFSPVHSHPYAGSSHIHYTTDVATLVSSGIASLSGTGAWVVALESPGANVRFYLIDAHGAEGDDFVSLNGEMMPSAISGVGPSCTVSVVRNNLTATLVFRNASSVGMSISYAVYRLR